MLCKYKIFEYKIRKKNELEYFLKREIRIQVYMYRKIIKINKF